MSDYPYTTVPGKLSALLKKMREVGVPTKADQKWLQSIGFKSSNDRTILGILKYIGFVDESGVPTSRWREYRGVNHKQVLANAVREGYSGFFDVYPDAHDRSAKDIEHVVSTRSNAGQQAVTKTVRTFQTLCAEADFSALGTTSTASSQENTPNDNSGVDEGRSDSSGTSSPDESGGSSAPSLHVDIQVHISPEATADQIDQIFASMSKHLYRH